jgi:hypothetical protein
LSKGRHFSVTGTITLTSGAILIGSGPLSITGPGAASLTIDGSLGDRIFDIVESGAPSCPSLSGPNDYIVSISA